MSNCEQSIQYVDWSDPKGPPTILYTGVECTGNIYNSGNGEFKNAGTGFEYPKAINSVFVPPNYHMFAFNDSLYKGQAMRLESGFYRKNDDYPSGGFPLTNIRSFSVIAKQPWIKHLQNCCSSKLTESTNSSTCGVYWGKNNSGECDVIMGEYCINNQNDPVCSCYNYLESDNDTDPPEVKLAKARPDCFIKTCNTDGYMPTNLKNRQCPSLKICKQNMDMLGGDQNVTSNIEILQNCNDTYNSSLNPTPSPTPPPTPSPIPPPVFEPPNSEKTSESSYIIYFLIFVCFIITIIAVVYFSSKLKNKKNDQENEQEDDQNY
jgi:hypothetical protein